MLSLSVLIDEAARSFPDKTAIVCGEKRITFAELKVSCDTLANGLVAAGLRPGDRVALSCPNLPWFPIAYFGIIKAGCTVVPLNILLNADEVAYHLEDSAAKAYIAFEGSQDVPIGRAAVDAFRKTTSCTHLWLIESGQSLVSSAIGQDGIASHSSLMTAGTDNPHIDSEAIDTVVILYTSGTTGKPKGAELTHANILLNAIMFGRLSEAVAEDRQLITLPLFHTFGQTVQMCGSLLNGNTMVLVPRFDPKVVVELMIAEKITVFCGVPTMYWALLNGVDISPDQVDKIRSHLRLCGSGGSSLPLEVLKGFEEKFDVPILEGYGLSETSPVACFNLLSHPRKPGSVGLPIWGVEVRILDDANSEVPANEHGEICIRGHNVMKGYLNKPEATAKALKNGWFHTGDIGYIDEEGYIFIVDRLKDMIIRGGYNVYPREIEEVLLTHPAISLAAVIGVPDEQYGEEVRACIILKAGQQASPEELVAWSKAHMAGHKYPRQFEIRESLPMTATGKILKRELVAELKA
ncbi:long-chain-fatty-acid--CoA ligase [Allohahella sp. A8]|uniref:long-chain-fatty-acid--CoA ligase n=1 Tax=Allohahella sp. A8 TaxID=3141461 RepID=UPI000C0A48E0|nr:long-chain-fatty-acid--CoA ligase [Hahellaceae bacterium]|tara:strand:+ start:30769 stop:32334 length:1566 start_codon:yes stop_codon:yes gene_type:complete